MPCSFVSAAAAAGTVVLAGIASASAQPIVVEDWYAPPVYVAPAPLYAAPVIVAPAPRVYVAPRPAFAQHVVRTRRVTRAVIVRESGWDW